MSLVSAVPAVLGAAAVLALSAAPAHAAGGSLAYAQGGNVFLAAPDGSGARQLTTGGGYAWPSQADDGTVVAVRQTTVGERTPRHLHRMDRTGKALNAPVETVDADNSFYIGPLAPKVSPDGRFVAYHYFYTGPVTDDTAPRIGISHSDRDTVNGEITSTLGGYLTPSWLQDGRLLAFYAKERTTQVDIWSPDDTVVNWFADPEVAPLLTDGEVTRAGDRLAAMGSANDLRLYELPGPPPAAPVLRCVMTGFGGDASDPTWSPDGRSLAWEEPDGIHVAALEDLAACGSAARPLVVPGGADPDWGVAEMGAAGGGAGDGGGAGGAGGGGSAGGGAGSGDGGAAGGGAGTGGLLSAPGLPASVKASALLGRRGLAVRARCSAACRVAVSLRVDARTARRLGLGRRGVAIATGTVSRAAAGSTVTVRVRPTAAARRRLRRAGTFSAKLAVTATTTAAPRRSSTRTKTIRVRRG